ncbi:Ni/Fe-hydrogenase, b-type cytochrome subunit [Seleniivibrio sp.]|uniref:Ni/Fe-hydrogenase, b-type cytochrome subunit n=1 Tax=Seleniivibrio sp. TaxID=2898801 RepID=UPI0025FACE19|nr:Ni/Fe-hydrogenase, b-type cytochrome subunit [Seleniivibrio sp.]MCD8554241.1 Ni/Fe-hydrogenase, b-type cytochrome subunit [Seleniivibrio sp.]
MSAAAATEDLRQDCPARGFVYVWQAVVRITHWVNVLSIIILAMTGLYMHYPFLKPNPVDFPYMMGYARFIHYLTGVIFSISVLSRMWWGIVGNKYSNIRTFYNPFNKQDRKMIIAYLKYYGFLDNKAPHMLTHNPMAQYAYIAIFLVFLFQIFSGFALWSQINTDSGYYAFFGSIFSIMSNQWVRYLHYFVVYVTLTFLIVHLYAAVLVDFRTHSGDISSIFSGWKADIQD